MDELRCAFCGLGFDDARDRHCHDCNGWMHEACHEEHAKAYPSELMPGTADLGDYARHFWRHVFQKEAVFTERETGPKVENGDADANADE